MKVQSVELSKGGKTNSETMSYGATLINAHDNDNLNRDRYEGRGQSKRERRREEKKRKQKKCEDKVFIEIYYMQYKDHTMTIFLNYVIRY